MTKRYELPAWIAKLIVNTWQVTKRVIPGGIEVSIKLPHGKVVLVCPCGALTGDWGAANGSLAYVCVDGVYSVYDLLAADVASSRRTANVATPADNRFVKIEGDQLHTTVGGINHVDWLEV